MQISTKNKYLIAGFILMLFLSYKLALRKTLVVKKNLAQNIIKKEAVINLPQQLSALGQKDKFLSHKLDSLDIGSSSTQNNLLKFINSKTEKKRVKIIDFTSPHIVQTDKGVIETYMLVLEGSYTAILKTLNAVENKGSFGILSHLNFEKKRDYRSKRTYLQATIFLEKVK